jgi:hypothetical protein
MPQYDRSGGALFRNQSDNPKAPVYQGDITILKEDMRLLVEDAQAGKEVKIRIAAFKKEGRKGPFLSLAVTPWSTHEKELAEYKAKRDGGYNEEPAAEGDPWDI